MAKTSRTLDKATKSQLELGLSSDGEPQTDSLIDLREPESPASEPKGVVYTRSWVVELMLDLAGYRPNEDLAASYAVEPAAGTGAFLLPMVRRLIASLQAHGRKISDAARALRAYELDASAAAGAIEAVTHELISAGIDSTESDAIARGWVTVGDYLVDSRADRRADLVVGNPPYIRYDDIPDDVLLRYRALYPTMVGRGDIYIGFIEAGLRQLREGGALAFICADRWMRAAYGIELRRLIAESCSVEAMIEMHNAPAFEDDVSAYPAVFVVRRAPQGEALVASAGPKAGLSPADRTLADAVIDLAHGGTEAVAGFSAGKVGGWFRGGSPWPSVEPDRLELLRHLESEFGPLEDALTGTKIGIGVATGADRVYITKDKHLVEPDRLLPLAMSADTRDGAVKWSGHYLVNPWTPSGALVDLEAFPKLRAYFESRSTELRSRNIAGRMPKDWYRTIDKVNDKLLRAPKLYFPDMKMMSHPTLDKGETYPHHNLYFLTSEKWDLEVLGGLLLSRIAQLFIEAYCVKMRGGTLRFQAQYLRRIRVPAPDRISGSLSGRLRKAFRTRDAGAATAAALEAYGFEPNGVLP